MKQSALSELDLPVQTTYGHLGNLVLKIPWKNLYSAPVEAYIDRLYLLAVPNSSVRYNADREDKASLEAKKAELDRIQLAKKLEQEKSKSCTSSFPNQLIITSLVYRQTKRRQNFCRKAVNSNHQQRSD